MHSRRYGERLETGDAGNHLGKHSVSIEKSPPCIDSITGCLPRRVPHNRVDRGQFRTIETAPNRQSALAADEITGGVSCDGEFERERQPG